MPISAKRRPEHLRGLGDGEDAVVVGVEDVGERDGDARGQQLQADRARDKDADAARGHRSQRLLRHLGPVGRHTASGSTHPQAPRKRNQGPRRAPQAGVVLVDVVLHRAKADVLRALRGRRANEEPP